jgi:hypothetical protein
MEGLIPTPERIAELIRTGLREEVRAFYHAAMLVGGLLGLAVALALLYLREAIVYRLAPKDERENMRASNLGILLAAAVVAAVASAQYRPPEQPARKRADADFPALRAQSLGAAVGPVAPDGTEIHCDLPAPLHTRNTSSKGLGNCVFTSIHHSAHWQEVPQLQGFAQWLTKKGIPGGGYPSKVAKLIPEICKDKGLPEPKWIQVEGVDLGLLRLACKTGRMPAITYSKSPTGRYGGRRIAHMVSLPHADEKWFGVLDNNYPGPDKIEWMSEREFLSVGPDWSVILLEPGPPPPPRNLSPARVEPRLLRCGWARTRFDAAPPPPPAKKVIDQGPVDAQGRDVGYRFEQLVPVYRWTEADGHWFLWRDGKQAGVRTDGVYRPLLGPGRLGEPCKPPVLHPDDRLIDPSPEPPPEGELSHEAAEHGVEWEQIHSEGAPRYWLNGETAARQDCVRALCEGKEHLVDDSALPWLVIAGDDAARTQVLRDLESSPELAFYKGKAKIKAYPKTHWALEAGFETRGNPTVYLQTSDGQVLHVQDDYDGAGPLAEAIRKADPAYKRDRDPDRRKPDPKPGPKPDGPDAPDAPGGTPLGTPTCIICGLAGAYFLNRATQKKAA